MEGNTPMYEITDDWSKILIYSVVHNNIPNQGLETKIIGLLRSLKKEKESKSTKLKIMIILWYMKNRSLDVVNNIILFELVNNFLGISEYTDGLIISVLNGVINTTQLGLKVNKKFRSESLLQMVKKVRSTELSDICKILALPLYLQYDIIPTLGEVDIQNTIEDYFLFESVCYYARYCKNADHVRSFVPQNEIFIKNLSKFIQKDFEVEEFAGPTDLCLEDTEIYKQILTAYDLSIDKNIFKVKLIEFISNLK
ncbi:hypothetical protein NBO_13g0065 [Nosema bombycis CQ1]|uniref:Uncharacterized protein n=1 Tax=Nosema bombycis (strain CQ1 / CVCC 102059) TaxID=578461 RepID=R0MPW7_NOSB1|nr:hypothetical protein NBO_13g0065 [Nosema bombycis CQ1]|eukprot:EOB14888.1 hypothetical protein NBO_13g0065 [Nosema bombycis CQ1]